MNRTVVGEHLDAQRAASRLRRAQGKRSASLRPRTARDHAQQQDEHSNGWPQFASDQHAWIMALAPASTMT